MFLGISNPIVEVIKKGVRFPTELLQNLDSGILLIILDELKRDPTNNTFVRVFNELVHRHFPEDTNHMFALLIYSKDQPGQRSLIISGLKEQGYDVGDIVNKICRRDCVDGKDLDALWFERSNGNIWSFIALARFSSDSYQSMIDDVVGNSLKDCHADLSMTELLWLNRFQFANGDLLPKYALKQVKSIEELVLYLNILSMRDLTCNREPLVKK